MLEKSSFPKPQEHAWLWFAKLSLGVCIIAIMALHMIVNHMIAPGGLLDYAAVVAYYQNPIIPAIEIFFLLIVVTHSLLGTRSILLDLNLSGRLQKAIDGLMIILGIGAIIYGTWLALTISGKG